MQQTSLLSLSLCNIIFFNALYSMEHGTSLATTPGSLDTFALYAQLPLDMQKYIAGLVNQDYKPSTWLLEKSPKIAPTIITKNLNSIRIVEQSTLQSSVVIQNSQLRIKNIKRVKTTRNMLDLKSLGTTLIKNDLDRATLFKIESAPDTFFIERYSQSTKQYFYAYYLSGNSLLHNDTWYTSELREIGKSRHSACVAPIENAKDRAMTVDERLEYFSKPQKPRLPLVSIVESKKYSLTDLYYILLADAGKSLVDTKLKKPDYETIAHIIGILQGKIKNPSTQEPYISKKEALMLILKTGSLFKRIYMMMKEMENTPHKQKCSL
jgi:hypothetical protein